MWIILYIFSYENHFMTILYFIILEEFSLIFM